MAESIKGMFVTLAKYNSTTNKDVIKVIKRMEPDQLIKDFGSYFGSILGILNHQLVADIMWLRGYGKKISSLDFILPIIKKIHTERKPPKELQWSNLEDYKSVRVEIDELMERVVENLSPNQYTSMLKMEDQRGSIEFVTWRYLLHLFNHHTHHRGGVAMLLDQLKVKNEFSGLLWKK